VAAEADNMAEAVEAFEVDSKVVVEVADLGEQRTVVLEVSLEHLVVYRRLGRISALGTTLPRSLRKIFFVMTFQTL
jgi:hypothetical protein